MPTFERFEDIEAWQMARDLTRAVYLVSGQGRFAKDFPLRDQIRRAAVSVMSNIAEGFDRGSTHEFLQFLAAAKGSASEVRSQLYAALDQEYISADQFREVGGLAERVGRVVGGLMAYLRRSGTRGVRFLDGAASVPGEPGAPNHAPRTPNARPAGPRRPNPEPRTPNPEPKRGDS
ncbi:MAG: four helix bundle protein [Armatimonadetes bacterium]|nr:four helix bundle protein [Armatimonadota bacterium]